MPLSTKTKLKIANALSKAFVRGRALGGLKSEGVFRRRGIHWWLDLNEGIDFAIFLFGAFEPGTRRYYTRRIQKGYTVLDIGANIGAHSLPFAYLVGPAGRVYCFEATEYAVGRLRRNIDLNPLVRDRVKVVHALLTDGSDRFDGVHAIESRWPLDASIASRVSAHGGEAEGLGAAKRASLDSLLASEGLERVDFVKLDVDGYEWPILQGARQTIETHRPTVLLELAPDCDPAHFADMLGFFLDRGYASFDLSQARPLPRDAASIRHRIPRNGSINVVALPN
ncbi:MAG: FkbM family methyltransferase [Opitutales bacterium]|nr:FkbM family methyltransferase [Opitutales bacterium]